MKGKELKKFYGIDKKRFHIRRRIQEHITADGVRLGYKSFFTDYNKDTLSKGYFLMENEMLVIVHYADKRLEAYLSARGYLKTHAAELEAAEEFDAVSLLDKTINKTP